MLIFARLILYLVAILVIAPNAYTQTLFRWPVEENLQTAVDIKSYTDPEACIAAGDRVTKYYTPITEFIRDTMPYSFDEVKEPYRPEAIEIARRCSENFRIDSVDIEDAQVWLKLFLMAGRESAAKEIIDLKLQLTKKQSPRNYASAADSFAAVYLAHKAPRLSEAALMLEKAFEVDTVHFTSLERLRSSLSLFTVAERVGENDTASFWANRSAEMFEKLSLADKSKLRSELITTQYINNALSFISKEERFDSLRVSTESYINFYASLIEAYFKLDAKPFLHPMGLRAPRLRGEFWFTSEDNSKLYKKYKEQLNVSVTGDPALIVFINREDCNSLMLHRCSEYFAVLRRLNEAFPDLQIALVSQTYGWFDNLGPLKPEEEAEKYAEEWLGFYRIKANLVVSETPHFFLPDRDERRINLSVENAEEYGLGFEGGLIKSIHAVLVDKEGVVVGSVPLSRFREKYLREMIEILFKRNKM